MNIREIESEIEKLEHDATTYQNCSKLAVLYSVRDHLADVPAPREEVAEYSPMYSYAKSDFTAAFTSAPMNEALDILDEHMECIKVLYPKEYSAIIKRIKALI